MTSPTIFGMSGSTVMAGGEAGAEAVLPLDMLWDRLGSMIESKDSSKQIVVNNYISVERGNSDDDAFAKKIANKIGENVKVIRGSL